MSVKDTLLPFELKAIDSAGFDGTFQVINTDGFPHACCYMRLINNSDTDVLVSFDGDTIHDFVEDGGKLEIYSQISSLPNNSVSLLKKGTKVYVSGAGAGVGLVFLSGYYRPQN